MMDSKSCKIKIAELSDVHLGHPNTPTTLIIKNLKIAFPDNAETGELDLIILAGDIFDRLLNLPDDDVYPIRKWVNQFLRICERRNIIVRVLEGTPSHDWKQSKLFEEVNEIACIGADCKYVETLSIEYIEKLDINVLYVPDEWRPDPNQTWLEVQGLLKQNNLTQVDYAVMHGSFPHQIPDKFTHANHNPERYLSIVKYIIFIGHIHKYSQHERIFAAGSFDRLNHGEEEPKGHLRYTLHENDSFEMVFVENKTSKIYKTIDCKDMDASQLNKYIEKVIKDLPIGSAIRISSNRGEIASTSLKYFKEKYPNYQWDKTDNKSSKNAEELLLKKREHKTITVTPDNIIPLLMERIKVKYPDSVENCHRLLKGVVNG